MRSNNWLGVLVLAFASLFASTSWAQGAGAVRKQVEMSMRVSGEIAVDAQGQVVDHSWKEEVPAGVMDFLEQQVASWTFVPQELDGHPVAARNGMTALLVAKKLDSGDYEMRLQATDFFPLTTIAGSEIAHKEKTAPIYPKSMLRARAAGIVYLALKIGREGKVEEAMAEQVNLRAVASEKLMERMRRTFAESALSAARRWTFTVPVVGASADEESWAVTVPVSYTLGDATREGNGQWIAYIPGPRAVVPWRDPTLDTGSPEALGEGVARVSDKHALRLRPASSSEG